MTTQKTKKQTAFPKIKNTISDIEKRIFEEMERQILADWSPEHIQAKVKLALEDTFSNAIAQHMGFRYASNSKEWELSSFNKDSPAVVIIRKHAEQVITDLIKQGCSDGTFKLSEDMIKKLIRQFNKSVTGYECEKIISQHAREQVSKLVQVLSGSLKGASS